MQTQNRTKHDISQTAAWRRRRRRSRKQNENDGDEYGGTRSEPNGCKRNDVCIACTWTGHKQWPIAVLAVSAFLVRAAIRFRRRQQFVSSKNKSLDCILPVHRSRFACHSDAATLLQAFPHYVVTHPVPTTYGTFEIGPLWPGERALFAATVKPFPPPLKRIYVLTMGVRMTHCRSDRTRSTLVLFGFWSFTLLRTNRIGFYSSTSIRHHRYTAVGLHFVGSAPLPRCSCNASVCRHCGGLANVANHHNFSPLNFWI